MYFNEIPYQHSRTPITRINLEGAPSGYAEIPENWIFFENRLQWQSEFRLLIFTLCTCV